MHLVYSSVYLPTNNYNNNNNHAPSALLQQQQRQRLATQLAATATARTIIKIILDACWTLNNGSKCTHLSLSLFSPLSPNAPPPPTTTTMRRTDSKARHSRWCWWSLNIPLRRHSPSQMFVTIFSFVFYFPYIFMFRAKKIPETILPSSNPIQLHSYTVNIVSNFPSFLYYFIITLLSFNKTVVAPRRVRFHT